MSNVYTCPACGTNLELQPELTEVDAEDNDDIYVYFQCPACKTIYGTAYSKPSYRHLKRVA